MERWSFKQHLLGVLLFILANVTFVQAQAGPVTGPSSGPFPVDSGCTLNASNTTLTSLNSSVVFLVNISGNHTLTLPNVTTVAGREFVVYVMCNGKIGVTGNYTINATSGNINGGASIVVTNTTDTDVGNVSMIRCKAMDTTYGYSVGVTRR